MPGVRNVEVVVQLEGLLAERWRTGAASGVDAAQLRNVLAQAGATLQSQHPGMPDPELSRWFVAQVGDDDEGVRLAAALLALHGVDAAYAKPTADLPLWSQQ